MPELTPDEIVELPVDELGLLVMQNMLDISESNEQTYYLRHIQSRDSRFHHRNDTHQAIAEAITWLRSNGLVARNPLSSDADVIFVTRRGHWALETGLDGVRALARIEAGLHPLIERQARRRFLLGEYENAIFSAMKQVEIRVRKLGGFGDDSFGKDLMIAAFKPGGPLADPAAVPGETQGTQMLFQGAYALLRKPSAHREVSFDDVAEAADAVMTVSFLKRILDGVEKRINGARALPARTPSRTPGPSVMSEVTNGRRARKPAAAGARSADLLTQPTLPLRGGQSSPDGTSSVQVLSEPATGRPCGCRRAASANTARNHGLWHRIATALEDWRSAGSPPQTEFRLAIEGDL